MKQLKVLLHVALLALTLAVVSCGSLGQPAIKAEPLTRGGGRDLIVVLAPHSETVESTIRALRSELKSEYDVQVVRVSRDATPRQLGTFIKAERPVIVVLLDNPIAALYRNWVSSVANPPPSLLLLSSFVGPVQAAIPNSMGIAYEIPAVTALVEVRTLFNSDIVRAGVVFRKQFRSHVRRQRELAAVEELELVGIEIKDAARPRDLRAALASLREQGVDALWVMNDNHLLSPLMLQEWLKQTRAWPVPIVVGVPSLINAETHFGTYAAVPDHEALGVQAADLVYSIADQNFSIVEPTVQLPISIQTYVDLQRAKELGMDRAREAEVDFPVTSARRGR